MSQYDEGTDEGTDVDAMYYGGNDVEQTMKAFDSIFDDSIDDVFNTIIPEDIDTIFEDDIITDTLPEDRYIDEIINGIIATDIIGAMENTNIYVPDLIASAMENTNIDVPDLIAMDDVPDINDYYYDVSDKFDDIDEEYYYVSDKCVNTDESYIVLSDEDVIECEYDIVKE